MAEAMAQFLSDRSGIHFTAYRPPNYGGWWFITLIAVSALAIIYMKLDSIKEHLNRDTIGYLCVVASLIFTSGQMWNSIRGPQEPLLSRTILFHEVKGKDIRRFFYRVFSQTQPCNPLIFLGKFTF